MKIYISGPMDGYPEHNFPLFERVEQWLLSLGYEITSPRVNSLRVRAEYGGRPAMIQQLGATAARCRFLHEDAKTLLYCDAILLLPGWRESRGATFELLIAVQTGLQVFELKEHDSGVVFSMHQTHVSLHMAAEYHWVNEAQANKPTAAIGVAHVEDNCSTSYSYPAKTTTERERRSQLFIQSGTQESTQAAKAAVRIGSISNQAKGNPDESVALEADRLVDGSRQKDYGHPLDNYIRVQLLWSAYLEGKYGTSVNPWQITAEDTVTMMGLLKDARLMNGYHRDSIVDKAGYAKVLDMCFTERKRRQDAQ